MFSISASSSEAASSRSRTMAGTVVEARQPRGAPAALAGDQLEGPARSRADQHRLEHSPLAQRVGEGGQAVLVEAAPGLVGVGLDRVEGERAQVGLGAPPASGRSGSPRARGPCREGAAVAGLATGGHLLGQGEVGLRPGAVRVVMDHGAAEARRLADADVARDHGVEDELGEVLAHLALDVLRQAGAAVVHGQHHPGEVRRGLALALDQSDACREARPGPRARSTRSARGRSRGRPRRAR